MNKILMKCACLLLFLALLSGCSLFQDPSVHDPSQNLTREDFKSLSHPPEFFEEADEEEPTPVFPEKPRSGLSVTLTLEGKTTAGAIAKEIANQLKIGHMIQANKDVDISYSVNDRDIEDVLDDLESLTGLVFELAPQMISVKKNDLTFKTYDCHHLALTRTLSSDLSINTSSTGGQNDKGTNASQTKITSSFQNNFWEELNRTLAQILGVSSLSLETGGQRTPKEARDKEAKKHPSYSLNRQSGQITVYAKHREHQAIETLLEKIKVILSSQIHIEAKVVEIQLNDAYRSGINWTSLRRNLTIGGAMGTFSKNTSLPSFAPSAEGYQFSLKNGAEFNSVLSLMETFGTVRTLSSPRLTVLNNHTAVLKVADNLIFFKVKTDIKTNISNAYGNHAQERLEANSDIQTVPVGFIMTVQPSIDPVTREILLYLKPTITSVKSLRSDPAVELSAKRFNIDSVKSEVPVISVREIDSILRMDSGSIAILGGLMQEKSHNVSGGIPGFHDTPLSFLTHGKSNDHAITELVIFIKASIARTGKKAPQDQHVYQTFFSDPRPLMPLKDKKDAKKTLAHPSA